MDLSVNIKELLYNYDCVIIPGFGAFVLNYKPAYVNTDRNIFMPPDKEIIFNSAVNRNDGLLADYIAEKINCSYEEALLILKDSVEELKINLNHGKKVSFNGLGTFSLNREGNYQFEAFSNLNLSLFAYGMTNFNSPAINRDSTAQRIEKKIIHNDLDIKERKVISAVVWSAAASVLVLIALTLTFLNTDILRNTKMNYTGLLNSLIVRLYNNDLPKQKPAISKPVIAQLADTSSVAKDTLSINDDNTDQAEASQNIQPANVSQAKYYIIGGCFSIEENAGKFVKELSEKGYDAVIIGKTNRGLIRVAYQSFTDITQAEAQLTRIHSSENPGAWLLTMSN